VYTGFYVDLQLAGHLQEHAPVLAPCLGCTASCCRISCLEPGSCATPWLLVAQHKAIVAMPRAPTSVCELWGCAGWSHVIESERRCGLCRPQGSNDVLHQRRRLHCVRWGNHRLWKGYESRLSQHEVQEIVLVPSRLEAVCAPATCSGTAPTTARQQAAHTVWHLYGRR
jgi:hypothetical protein